jgi:AhpD family alkylhydroperoxidase
MKCSFIALMLVTMALMRTAFAFEPSATPKPIPQTRNVEKEALNALRDRNPRLPLPPPTEEELKQAAARAAERGTRPGERSRSGLGGGIVNNGRMRSLYLPAELRGSSGGVRQSDPNMTLDYGFTVELFWIVSRVNNCHYCLGHQESKLLSAGIEEPRIAALDSDWSRFSPAERAAYAFTRKLTFEPHLLTQTDVDDLLKYYKPLQALEIAFHVARYNSTNRWTDSLGIPQEKHRDFLTETPQEFVNKVTIVALREAPAPRNLPSRTDALAALAAAKNRKPRLPLASATETAQALDLPASGVGRNWQRLLCNFPVTGKSQAESLLVLQEKGTLPALLKAQIACVCARQDRAWYALAQAQKRLKELGQNEDAIFALDEPEKLPREADRAALAFAAKLTAIPQGMTDADVERLKKHYEPSQVAEIVHRVCQAAFFDRITEAAAIPVE